MKRLMITLFATLVVTGCSTREYAMPGEAMAPTLDPGEHFTVDLDAYEDALPSRWDLIVFKSPLMTDKTWCFRVVALPGETVDIEDGAVTVNDEPLSPPSLLAYMSYDVDINRHELGMIFPMVVPEGEYFVLGDNLAIAKDSRTWGCVPLTDIIGKAYEYPDEELLEAVEADAGEEG